MAKEKKLVQSITSRDEDFAQWYTDVVREAKLCDYSGVKGCLNYLPNGYAIWENIQADLDRRFKETGVENVYLPVLIPESLLQKEKDHIEGFAPEVAWVTHGGMEKLQERFCIRPTSETLFCDVWSKTVQSYRDLPKVWNQWCSVLRWEKTTRPFLRSREFLWQEGHTIHATYEEAEERTKMMWEVYKSFVEEDLAIPVVAGRKTESEKFAGAQDTYTIESLMHDGQALQSRMPSILNMRIRTMNSTVSMRLPGGCPQGSSARSSWCTATTAGWCSRRGSLRCRRESSRSHSTRRASWRRRTSCLTR